MALLSFKPDKEIPMKKYKLRSTSCGKMNLPPEAWEDAGWDLNDEIVFIIGETYGSKGEWKYITIERLSDLEKYDDEYPYKESKDG